MTSSKSFVKFDKVDKSYDGKVLVVKDLNLDINEGELIVQIYGVHEYIMNEDSIVLEIKNGPYYGPDVDRKRIDIVDKPS